MRWSFLCRIRYPVFQMPRTTIFHADSPSLNLKTWDGELSAESIQCLRSILQLIKTQKSWANPGFLSLVSGVGIARDSRLAAAHLGLGTSSQPRLLARHDSAVQSPTHGAQAPCSPHVVSGVGIEPTNLSLMKRLL